MNEFKFFMIISLNMRVESGIKVTTKILTLRSGFEVCKDKFSAFLDNDELHCFTDLYFVYQRFISDLKHHRHWWHIKVFNFFMFNRDF